MSWQISRKGDRYRIWSTVSDQWLTDWISRNEAIAFYYEDVSLQFKKNVIQQCLSFPHHWPDHDSRRYGKIIVDEDGAERYGKWLRDLLDKNEEGYERFVDETFSNVLRECEVSNEDGTG